MPQPKLTASVRAVGPHMTIIDIQGEVNAFAENILMDAFVQASSGQTQIIAMNFAGLEYMNSSGIGLLVTLLIRAQRQRQRLIAFGLNDHYQQIFELTRLNEAIVLYPNEAEAVTALDTLRPPR